MQSVLIKVGHEVLCVCICFSGWRSCWHTHMWLTIFPFCMYVYVESLFIHAGAEMGAASKEAAVSLLVLLIVCVCSCVCVCLCICVHVCAH